MMNTDTAALDTARLNVATTSRNCQNVPGAAGAANGAAPASAASASSKILFPRAIPPCTSNNRLVYLESCILRK